MRYVHARRCSLSPFKEEEYQNVDWPGISSDLNPIENLLAILKYKVADGNLTNAKNLEMAINCIRTQKNTVEYFKHLVHSMPCCLQAVVKSKNGHTNY